MVYLNNNDKINDGRVPNGSDGIYDARHNYKYSDEWVKYGFEFNPKFVYKLLDYDPANDHVIGWFKKSPEDELTLCKWSYKTGRCIVGYDGVPEFDLKKDDYGRIITTGFNASSIDHALHVWEHFLTYAYHKELFKYTKAITAEKIISTSFFLKMISTLLKNKPQNHNFITFSQILEYVKGVL